ncbi:futalosine hydrolase [Oceanithermus sp.]
MLIVYATREEAGFLRERALGREVWRGRERLFGSGWRGLELGVGKVNAAATLAAYLETHPEVERVLLVGIAGAYPGSGLKAGELALAGEEIQADLGTEGGLEPLGFPAVEVAGQRYFNHYPADTIWTAELFGRLGLEPQTFLTRDRVSESREEAAALARRWGALLENMEGAAVAQAALLFGVAWAELRAISNEAGVRDRQRWDVPGALAALGGALDELLA